MKLKNCLSNEFAIIIKTPNDVCWHSEIHTITTPTTLVFAISTCNTNENIKKISWDFGTGNQIKNITNRKQNLQEHGISCKYKKSNGKTLSIYASVYTDNGVFLPKPIDTVTSNELIKEHYVEPEEFKNQILKYYKTDKFTDDVASSIYKIANRLAFAPNFINYSYREEMVGDAVIRMIEALTTQKFDPLKGNPFSYFTKIAFHAFCNRIKKEKKIRKALTDYQNEVYRNLGIDNPLLETSNDTTEEEYNEDN